MLLWSFMGEGAFRCSLYLSPNVLDVSGNGQALLGMPDTDPLNIINIHSIGTEHGGGNENCCTNKYAAQSADIVQKTNRTEKCYTNTDSILKSENTDKPKVNNKLSNTTDYFLPGRSCDSDKKIDSEITQQLPRDFEDVFNAIGCFDGTISLQLKLDSKPYQLLPRCVAYVLQKPFKEELKQLQQQDIITPPGDDETVEWCNSFVLVPKANGRIRLCLDPT